MFIQYWDRLCGNLPEYLVGHSNINDMLKYILILFTGIVKNDRVKRFGDFIDRERLLTNFSIAREKIAFNLRYFEMAMGENVCGYNKSEVRQLHSRVSEFIDCIRKQDITLQFGSQVLHMSDPKERVLDIRSKYFREIGIL